MERRKQFVSKHIEVEVVRCKMAIGLAAKRVDGGVKQWKEWVVVCQRV